MNQLSKRVELLEQTGFIDDGGRRDLETLIEVLTQDWNIPSTDSMLGAIVTHVAVALKRKSSGESVRPFDPALVEQIKASEEYPLASEIFGAIEAAMQKSLPEEERLYVLAHVGAIIIAAKDAGHTISRRR